MFFRIFRHLLPRARAWQLTTGKTLRRFFEALANSDVAAGAKNQLDGIYTTWKPETTDQPELWEAQFGLPNTLTSLTERRERIAATWKALGGQSPRYLQDTLRAAGFDVYVHEWWVPGTEPPLGVQAAATARDPNTYLGAGVTATLFLSCDGAADMQDGDAVAQDGASDGPSGYALVNKLFSLSTDTVSDGSPDMFDGGKTAQDGATLRFYNPTEYVVPTDPAVYPYFLYIGGETFPNKARVPTSRKNEFERLCLKICPAQLWLGILVEYS